MGFIGHSNSSCSYRLSNRGARVSSAAFVIDGGFLSRRNMAMESYREGRQRLLCPKNYLLNQARVRPSCRMRLGSIVLQNEARFDRPAESARVRPSCRMRLGSTVLQNQLGFDRPAE